MCHKSLLLATEQRHSPNLHMLPLSIWLNELVDTINIDDEFADKRLKSHKTVDLDGTTNVLSKPNVQPIICMMRMSFWVAPLLAICIILICWFTFYIAASVTLKEHRETITLSFVRTKNTTIGTDCGFTQFFACFFYAPVTVKVKVDRREFGLDPSVACLYYDHTLTVISICALSFRYQQSSKDLGIIDDHLCAKLNK